MAVDIVGGITKLVDQGAGQFMQEVVATARGNAPVDTGFLSSSISGVKVGVGKYEVGTNAVGRNGFAYPARIEFGQEVTATHAKALHFVSHGNQITTKHAAPSKQSHFMKKTVSKYGGTYTGK